MRIAGQTIPLGTLMGLFGGALLLYGIHEYVSLPSSTIVQLRDQNPAWSSIMAQRFFRAGAISPHAHRFVPLEDISPAFIRAVLAVEDGGFYRHAGFEWNAIERAYRQNLKSGRSRFGGSTITMQLAKNLFLSTDKSYLRKVKEAVLTMRLEKHLSKKRILELYLNIIELGPGIFGVEAAAQHYFHTSAKYLTRDEAMRLAAVIASPLRHTPFDNSRFNRIRQSVIRRKTGG